MIKLSYNDREIELNMKEFEAIERSLAKHEKVLMKNWENVVTKEAENALIDETRFIRDLYNKLDKVLSEKELPF